MKTFIYSILVLMILALVPYHVGCGGNDNSQKKPATTLETQKDTPERFVLRSVYDRKYSWSDFLGKPFMINFWATWCGPCRVEMPAMLKLYNEYQPKGLEIVGISLDDERTKEQVAPFVDRYNIPWVVLYGDLAVSDEFKLGPSIPVTLFFDAQGHETARLVGAQPEAAFRQELEKLFPDNPKS
jgi:cytochrome c biogenesis protein CcmG/thiol:disulfide interchange protein DsbE